MRLEEPQGSIASVAPQICVEAKLPETNRVELSASIVERKVLRYSPAGIPIVDCVLLHASHQQEAGGTRQVDLTINALAAGPVAEKLHQSPLGTMYRFGGFLAPRSRNGKGVVLHITEFELTERD